MNDSISRQVALDAVNDCGICIQKILDLPSTEPLTEEDYTELRDRFGEYVEFVVRDIITGNGERWNGIATGISVFSPLKYHLSYKEPKKGQPKWIPVTERLPENSRSVLIYTKEGGVAEGKYSKRTESWIQFRWRVPYAKVLAWMPLPEPFKGGDAE